MELKKLSNDEIKQLIIDNKITVADIVDAGICPTCFDKANDNILYGKNDDKMIYEDNVGSWKIMEQCNAQFDKIVYEDDTYLPIKKYWIDIK